MIRFLYTIGLLFIALILLCIGFIVWLNTSSPSYVWKKVKQEDMQSSIVFNENGERKLAIRAEELMSLASTVKIVVAIEYAFQVKEGQIQTEEKVSLSELEKYYIPNLDGGAHQNWLQYIEEQGIIHNDQVSLREVARGMIGFSSNANTEFLMNKLGIEQIEQRMNDLEIRDHSSLFYFTSALFIPYEIKEKYFPNNTVKEAKDEIIQEMRNMNEEEWIKLSTNIHEKLTEEEDYKHAVNIREWWNQEFDLLFSETFIESTTSEYAKIMKKINDQEFPSIAQQELEYVLGMLMENEANRNWLERAGKKGGSTQYILTDALFAEDKVGNKYELAIFFNQLKWYEGYKLMKSLNEFELKLLSDERFRKELID